MAPAVLPVAVLLAVAAASGASPATVNTDPSLLPSLPSFDLDPDGRATFVWSSYDRDREWMWAATLAQGRVEKTIELSPGSGVYCQPRFVSTGAGSGVAAWTRRREGRWEVVARRRVENAWLPVEVLSGAGQGMNAALAVAGAAAAVAYEDHAARERIALRVWRQGAWAPAIRISQENASSHRPALASGPRGEVWAFWDSYVDAERVYGVFARRVLPALSPIERLSPAGRNCLKPAAVYAANTGWAAAWVSTEEVAGGAGVLDHKDAILAAVRRGGAWRLMKNDAGAGIVPLAFGLLARMEPRFEPVWGYAGRRRHPILIADRGTPWLLWERRIHSGGQAAEPGRLCGRRLDGVAWSRPVTLDEGLVEYAVPESLQARDGRLTIVGRDPEHRFQALEVDLAGGEPFDFEPWPGWKPVRLPLRPAGPRRSLEIDGKRLFLYWGDLHVHSVLTPDAEGEVDELARFARDKALLDVVVLQENDSNSWSKKAFRDHRLNASEYALSVYYSRRYTEPGRFVALPGFEWSERTADDDRPNHRTVMYAGRDTPVARHTENASFERLCQVVEAAGGSMFTQHEVFRLTGCSADANIEVASGWGVFIRNPAHVHRALSAGHRVGFVATSDGHRRNPGTGGGLTGIYATGLTPRAILDALARRRVFATNGSRIVMEARANGRLMGEDVRAGDTVEMRVAVEAPAPIARAVLVRDRDEVHREPGGGRTALRAAFTDRPGAGAHWYYWRVELEGDRPDYGGNVKPAEGLLAWSSPHRVVCGR